MICALLISDLPKLSSMALLSSQRSPAADVGAPAWLIDPAEVGAAELGAPRDLLIVSGHSNPQDALLGQSTPCAVERASDTPPQA